MEILEYNRLVTKLEGKRKNLTIADVNEINRINNDISNGRFYKMVRNLEKSKCQDIFTFIGNVCVSLNILFLIGIILIFLYR